jgi:hypothetical protein
MNIYSKTFLIILFTSIAGLAQPIDIKTIAEITPHITNKRTLLILDIDNTLLTPETDLGSDQWFCHLMQEHINSGKDSASAKQHVLPLYFHVRFNTDLITTEPDLHQTLMPLKNLCDHIICLTAQSPALAFKTVEELQKNGLHFHIPDHHECEFDLPHPCLYKDGVLFCSGNDKGDALHAFLDYLGYCPEVVIFVDDKEYNLHAVERAAKKRNIEFIGLRYAGCDERAQAFNKEAAEKELQEFLMKYPKN